MIALFVSLFFFAFGMTVVYLFSVSRLRDLLEQNAPDYWGRIGRTTAFGRGQALGIINNLYTREMSDVCNGIAATTWLRTVRWLLPVSLALNIGVILLIVRLQSQG